MKIQLSTCQIGQKLKSTHGMILTYAGPNEYSEVFKHKVYYPDGSPGSRTEDGQVFVNKKLPEDHDIVEILPL